MFDDTTSDEPGGSLKSGLCDQKSNASSTSKNYQKWQRNWQKMKKSSTHILKGYFQKSTFENPGSI